MSKARLPKTDSIQELAKFWNAHDSTVFDDELEEVTERVFERESAITLHLESTEAKAVREMAKSKRIADIELNRECVLEKIHAT